ncbi:hypothetical protein NQ318_002750 [Aromia moschata]|uniref:Retropepsins domain-containing protein n=1 Tax=Aromia moschata TaxID=1265417 RepID=A0AAV8Y2W6_9CUCU|nr:hypothetical protein NQ318_002750 [Aromia moschata]
MTSCGLGCAICRCVLNLMYESKSISGSNTEDKGVVINTYNTIFATSLYKKKAWSVTTVISLDIKLLVVWKEEGSIATSVKEKALSLETVPTAHDRETANDCEGGDERPYLKVNVLGKSLLGLLDSGASVTILGGPGWEQVKDLGIELLEGKTKNRVANGEGCESLGSCEVHFSVRNRLKLVKVLVVTDLPHTLILGANFWKQMGIVPDLRHNEWHFSKEPHIFEVQEHSRGQTVLSQEEEKRLQEVVDNNLKFMGDRLGCTDLVQHKKFLGD